MTKKHLDEEKLTLLANTLSIDTGVMKKQYLSNQFAKEYVKYKVQKSQAVYELAESKTKYYLNNKVLLKYNQNYE